ncbi:MAG: hypothetical protein Q7J47_10500 [Azoarcus sp.]|nr:hypothetical protein [Azoarcus sp.]
MKTRRTRIALLIASLMLVSPTSAFTAVLGEIASLSAIGSPLRIEIKVPDGRLGNASSCLRIATPVDTGQGLPAIRGARISASGSGATTRIVVSSSETMLEPAAQLAIENVCEARMRREYTLLFPYPGTAPLLPDAAVQREALPAGTRTVTPAPSRSARTATSRTQRTQAPTGPATPTPPKIRESGAAQQDRLVVAAEEQGPRVALPLSGTASSNVSSLERREQEIAAAIDRSIVNQIELLARIKELEQIQTRLMEQASRIGVTITPPAASPLPAEAAPSPAAPSPAAETASTAISSWLLTAALALAALVIAAALIVRSRRQAPEPSSASTGGTAAPSGHTPAALDSPETVSPPVTLSSAHVAGVAPLEWDPSPSAFDSSALAPLVLEEEVEEHDSAIELADIMMSFGRVHGAAETLAEFIRGNPKQAVTPWLKLLEVYRAAGLRAEFDGLARQLNKTFNVKAVTWDNFDAARSAPDSLEKMPHLIAALQKQWGTRECQAYLHGLLRDNREGTREGFPLNVIDEILCLSAVLEQLLGPYKPPAAEPSQDAPPTIPPN